MALADRANQYIDQRKPWTLVKQPTQAEAVRGICTQGLNLFRTLMIYLKPVLPAMAEKAERFFAESPWRWQDAALPRLGAPITPYEALALRLDPKAVAALVEPVRDTTPAAAAAPGTAARTAPAAAASPADTSPAAPPAPISIEEFARVDLRVARILSAGFVAGSDKLLKLRVDLGEHGEREIFSGIRSAYDPATLVGRLTVVVANLEPRKMRFGVSAGMVLAAGAGGKDIFLLTPDSGAAPGMRIK
jgi:methionyl-tRNA synthetase